MRQLMLNMFIRNTVHGNTHIRLEEDRIALNELNDV
jgi:hypothetical protein